MFKYSALLNLVMDISEAIEKRFSCRSYLRRRLSEKDIVAILEAGIKAPNAGNLQNWDFIIIKDDETKEKLTKASLNQRWMMQADIFIVICSDSRSSKKYYAKRGDMYNSQNCAAAIENMLLTATSLKLGSCWVGAFETEAVERALHLPDNIRPEAIITLGYPKDHNPKKRRASLDAVVHFGEYGNKSSSKEFLPNLREELNQLNRNAHDKGRNILGRIIRK